MVYLEIFIAIPLIILSTQLYLYASSREGAARQTTCRGLGIVLVTSGTASLAFHSLFFVMIGFFFIMLGLRLIANGLDRLDKKIYMDSYQDDSEQ